MVSDAYNVCDLCEQCEVCMLSGQPTPIISLTLCFIESHIHMLTHVILSVGDMSGRTVSYQLI